MTGWKTAEAFVLPREGPEISFDSATRSISKWGIDIDSHPLMTADQIRNLSREEAAELHRLEHWVPIRCEEMPAIVALTIFNAAVNTDTPSTRGYRLSVKFAQLALVSCGILIKTDGKISPEAQSQTLTALNTLDPAGIERWRKAFFRARMESFIHVCEVNRKQIDYMDGIFDRFMDALELEV